MIVLPVLDANDQLIECELDARPFYIGLGWNETGGIWTLSVRDLDQEFLVSGIAAVPLWPLLRQVRRPEMPPGDLFVGCAADHALARDSFARGLAALVYFDELEIEEMKDGTYRFG